MVDQKISQLSSADPLDGSERIPLEQGGETKSIPSDTYGALANNEEVTGDWSFPNVTNMGKLRVKHSPRTDVTHRDFGADPTGATVSTTAIQDAFDFAETNGGAVVYLPLTLGGQYATDATLVIPKHPRVVAVGAGRAQSRILASGLASTDPVIKWDDSVTGHVEQGQGLERLLIDRDNTGPVVEFRQNSNATGSSGDRFKGRLLELEARNTAGADTSGDHIYLEYSLNMVADDLRFDGNHRGLVLQNGSMASLSNLLVPMKASAPALLTTIGGGNHRVLVARTEGGNGGPSYHLDGTKNCRLIGIGAEGDDEDAVVLLDNADGTHLVAPVIGVADASTATNPRGIKLVNSSGCTINGGEISSYDATFPDAGDSLELDSGSGFNTVRGLAIDSNDPAADLVDSGTDNEIELLAAAATPEYSRKTLTPLYGLGVLSTGGSPQFGSQDNWNTAIIQNGSVKIRVTSSLNQLEQPTQTRGVEPAADAAYNLGTASLRYNDLFLSSFAEYSERTTPGTPGTGRARTYLFDNGGSQELRIIFANGTVKTIATDV